MRAGLLPLFGLQEVSVLSGVQSLWKTDIFLSCIVIFFAMIAPLFKVLAMEASLTGRLPARLKPWLFHLARLAMADVFLIAVYITLAKGLGIGRLETAWGLYLFTVCVLTSLALSLFAAPRHSSETSRRP